MKRIFGMLVVWASCFVTGHLFAAGNNHSASGNSSAPAVHNSSSAPASVAVAPHLSGIPHSANHLPNSVRPTALYRPTVTYHNGNRTFNYPGVGVAYVQRSAHSNVGIANNNARTVNRSSGN